MHYHANRDLLVPTTRCISSLPSHTRILSTVHMSFEPSCSHLRTSIHTGAVDSTLHTGWALTSWNMACNIHPFVGCMAQALCLAHMAFLCRAHSPCPHLGSICLCFYTAAVHLTQSCWMAVYLLGIIRASFW